MCLDYNPDRLHRPAPNLHSGTCRFDTLDTHRSQFDRYTNNIQEMRVGGYIRWLDKKSENNWKLLNGGILLKINFTNKGTYIVCKNNNKMMQYLFDNYYTFQKITAEEWMCLMSNEVAKK